jgi:hypothetical protein
MVPGSPTRITTILPQRDQRDDLTMDNTRTVSLIPFTPSSQDAPMQFLALFACLWPAFDLNFCLLIDRYQITLFTST